MPDPFTDSRPADGFADAITDSRPADELADAITNHIFTDTRPANAITNRLALWVGSPC
jgi:hypothetical protein